MAKKKKGKERRGEVSIAKWPSLKRQLAAAKVVPGSALDQLIRDNQNFDMLRPEEAHDDLPLPPWLRVHWRKHHPDADYSGPSGGYPLVLHELYQWMLRHQDLVPDPAEREVPDDRPGLRPPAIRPKGERRGG
jgi:hypothetical protein